MRCLLAVRLKKTARRVNDDVATTAGLKHEMEWLQEHSRLSNENVHGNRADQVLKCFVHRVGVEAVVILSVGNERCSGGPWCQKS